MTNDVAQSPWTIPQSKVSRSVQSKVGKSEGLADGGNKDGGTSVELEVPSTRLVTIELTSSSHMLQVLGQIKTARTSLHTSLLTFKSAQPSFFTVS